MSRDLKEWIEVDLEGMKVISGIETQGRFGDGQVSGCWEFEVLWAELVEIGLQGSWRKKVGGW